MAVVTAKDVKFHSGVAWQDCHEWHDNTARYCFASFSLVSETNTTSRMEQRDCLARILPEMHWIFLIRATHSMLVTMQPPAVSGLERSVSASRQSN